MKGYTMRIRNILAASAVATVLGGSAIGLSGTANAATLTCTVTNTHHHSVTSKGTVSDYVLHENKCGKNFNETETGTSQSSTGAHSWYTWTKIETYPHWTKTEIRKSWTKTGKYTYTVTHSHN